MLCPATFQSLSTFCRQIPSTLSQNACCSPNRKTKPTSPKKAERTCIQRKLLMNGSQSLSLHWVPSSSTLSTTSTPSPLFVNQIFLWPGASNSFPTLLQLHLHAKERITEHEMKSAVFTVQSPTHSYEHHGTVGNGNSQIKAVFTWMEGKVLLFSVLCSPGMLPADLPSHLYLKRMPLCLGCSNISIQGSGPP